MYRYFKYCPKCQGLRAMNNSVALKTVTSPDGTIQEILVQNYHCEVCSTFIHSATDAEEADMVDFLEFQPSLPQA